MRDNDWLQLKGGRMLIAETRWGRCEICKKKEHRIKYESEYRNTAKGWLCNGCLGDESYSDLSTWVDLKDG